MGVDHLLQEMLSDPGSYAVSWVVLLTLLVMSAGSVYWIVINTFKNISLRRSADRVVSTFWETTNAQDAIRYMEEQSRSEPFRSEERRVGKESVSKCRSRGWQAHEKKK